MMTAPDETEWPTAPDPVKVAAMPLIRLVMESTKDGSLRRAEAMRQVLVAVAHVRQILNRPTLN